MGKYLDLDDVCYGNPEAQKELDELRGALAASKSLLDSLRAELEAVKTERDKAQDNRDSLARYGAQLRDKITHLESLLGAARKQRDEANALIEQMRKGEPVAWGLWDVRMANVEHADKEKRFIHQAGLKMRSA